eukprot:Gb_07659 [translate_table: standard]
MNHNQHYMRKPTEAFETATNVDAGNHERQEEDNWGSAHGFDNPFADNNIDRDPSLSLEASCRTTLPFRDFYEFRGPRNVPSLREQQPRPKVDYPSLVGEETTYDWWHHVDMDVQEESSERRQIFPWIAPPAPSPVKVPMVPVHIRSPEAHVEAPTAGSVISVGIPSKLGTYGFPRFSIPMFPEATLRLTPFIYTLSAIAIIYTSPTTPRQIDPKKIIAINSRNAYYCPATPIPLARQVNNNNNNNSLPRLCRRRGRGDN